MSVYKTLSFVHHHPWPKFLCFMTVRLLFKHTNELLTIFYINCKLFLNYYFVIAFWCFIHHCTEELLMSLYQILSNCWLYYSPNSQVVVFEVSRPISDSLDLGLGLVVQCLSLGLGLEAFQLQRIGWGWLKAVSRGFFLGGGHFCNYQPS